MRRLPVVIAITLLASLSACSGSDDPAPSPDKTTATGGSADGGDSDGGNVKVGDAVDLCSVIKLTDVDQLFGYPVTKEDTPGGGCSYGSEEDPKLASLSVTVGTPADQGGGFEAAKTGTQAVLNGDAVDVQGVGDQAFLVVGTGKSFAKEQIQAQGVIEKDGRIYTVGITQLNGATEADVRQKATGGMRLVGSKL